MVLNKQSLESFLGNLAGDSPTPGGGGAAAAAGAMGAALVSMVCNLTIGKKKYAAVEERMQVILTRAERLQADLTGMIQEDVEAFNLVMGAFRLPKDSAEEKAARRAAIQEGYKQATLVPLKTVRACAEVMELVEPVLEMGNPNAVSDAGVGLLCAQAGLKGAALNVLINLSAITDEAFTRRHRAELEQILAGRDELAEAVYQEVIGRI